MFAPKCGVSECAEISPEFSDIGSDQRVPACHIITVPEISYNDHDLTLGNIRSQCALIKCRHDD